MSGAWSYGRIVEEYNLLRLTWDAKSENQIRDMARQAVLATTVGGQLELSSMTLAGDVMFFPVRSRRGWKDIQVRLIPDMEREEALIIAERQIREQWKETT